MILGIPTATFLATLSWPFINITAAIIVFFTMKKQDALVDDREFSAPDCKYHDMVPALLQEKEGNK